jgi:hypothetical protein
MLVQSQPVSVLGQPSANWLQKTGSLKTLALNNGPNQLVALPSDPLSTTLILLSTTPEGKWTDESLQQTKGVELAKE